jgi:cell filamentation protein
MTFDPFGEFATEGYLRNFEKEKDIAIVKRAKNASFPHRRSPDCCLLT